MVLAAHFGNVTAECQYSCWITALRFGVLLGVWDELLNTHLGVEVTVPCISVRRDAFMGVKWRIQVDHPAQSVFFLWSQCVYVWICICVLHGYVLYMIIKEERQETSERVRERACVHVREFEKQGGEREWESEWNWENESERSSARVCLRDRELAREQEREDERDGVRVRERKRASEREREEEREKERGRCNCTIHVCLIESACTCLNVSVCMYARLWVCALVCVRVYVCTNVRIRIWAWVC